MTRLELQLFLKDGIIPSLTLSAPTLSGNQPITKLSVLDFLKTAENLLFLAQEELARAQKPDDSSSLFTNEITSDSFGTMVRLTPKSYDLQESMDVLTRTRFSNLMRLTKDLDITA